MFRNVNIPSSTSNIYDDLCSVSIEDSFYFSFRFRSFRSIKSKATSIDGLNNRFFEILLSKLLPYVSHVFNTVLTKSTFPDEWKNQKLLQYVNKTINLKQYLFFPSYLKLLNILWVSKSISILETIIFYVLFNRDLLKEGVI